jgi:hypothetical protein
MRSAFSRDGWRENHPASAKSRVIPVCIRSRFVQDRCVIALLLAIWSGAHGNPSILIYRFVELRQPECEKKKRPLQLGFAFPSTQQEQGFGEKNGCRGAAEAYHSRRRAEAARSRYGDERSGFCPGISLGMVRTGWEISLV